MSQLLEALPRHKCDATRQHMSQCLHVVSPAAHHGYLSYLTRLVCSLTSKVYAAVDYMPSCTRNLVSAVSRISYDVFDLAKCYPTKLDLKVKCRLRADLNSKSRLGHNELHVQASTLPVHMSLRL